MKKGIKLLILSIMLTGLTGCINLDGKTKINKDKSMEFSIKYGLDMSALEAFGSSLEEENSTEIIDPNAEQQESSGVVDEGLNEETEETSEMPTVDKDEIATKLSPKGFSVEEYNEGSEVGVIIKKTYKNIDDVSKEGKVRITLTDIVDTEKDYNDTQLFQYEKGLLKNKYNAYFQVDFTSENTGDEDLSSYASLYNLTYSVELPSKAISSNATSVSQDGKTLKWEFEIGKVNEINFEFAFVNTTMVYILFGAGALLLVVVIVLASRSVMKQRKKGKQTEVQPEKITSEPNSPEILQVNQPIDMSKPEIIEPTSTIETLDVTNNNDAIVLNPASEPVTTSPSENKEVESLFPKE